MRLLLINIKWSLFVFFFVLVNFSVCASVYSVLDFGAKGDGQSLETQAIQSAIDRAFSQGGGVVSFPPGKYISGSIIIKDYVILRFETGSILMGSQDLKDYPKDLGYLVITPPYVWNGPLIYAENSRYIGIEGNGIIDGRGTREVFPPFPRENQRPGLIRFKDCKFVKVSDVTMRNPACWTFHLKGCEDVSITNIVMNSNSNRNNDGIDIDDCRRVIISNCNLNAEDDAIVIKSFTNSKTSDVIISNCILTSTCSAIKIGTETVGDISNININNCVIYGSRGINLFSVDGSNINNVIISNISMRNSTSAFQIRLGARMRPYTLPKDLQPTTPGSIRNIKVDNLQAIIEHDSSTTGFNNSQNFIAGIPGHRIENVTLSNIYISFHGNGSHQQAQRAIPEEIRAYPKSGMFGDLPAYGFYVRHVDNIKFIGVKLDLLNEDLRPAISFDQVSNITLSDCILEGSNSIEPLIKLEQVNQAYIFNCRPKNKINSFVEVLGKKSNDIVLKNNFLSNAQTTFKKSNEVKTNSIKELNTIR